MTASKKIKAAGLEDIGQVSEITGKPERTLYRWSKRSPKLFEVVLLGCKERIMYDQIAGL